ncbi:MAG: glycine betaine ABC transporter substrate-binding protein [Solirubrobacteraceae bacterium]
MKITNRMLLALMTVLCLGVFAAGCGGDDDEKSADSSTSATTTAARGYEEGGLIERDEANAQTKLTIGSKNFAEQYILGEIYAQAFEAAGYDVSKQLDLGSEQIAFKSLKNGEIDAYPEYSGTALTSFYKVKLDDVPRDKDEAFTKMESLLAKDDIVAMSQTSFQNTYVVTSSKETAEKYDSAKTISELAETAGPNTSISGFPECRQRTDCLLGLKQVYGWTPKFVSSQGQYEDIDGKQSELTFGFSTDGALSLDKYATYEDDKSLFPPYYVSLLTRQDAADKLGDEGRALIERIQEPLTEEVMRELNSRVSIDKQKPQKVAAEYLREEGFTE